MSSILIVDDEAGVRELVLRQLRGAGHVTHEARTAEAALDLLTETSDIDVVIADLQMPGHGGAWLVERLANRFPNVAVILATADDSVPGTLSLKPSVVRYLVKPISGAQLIEAVAQGLRWREQQLRRDDVRAGGTNPVDSWLDKKLTRGHRDGGSSGR